MKKDISILRGGIAAAMSLAAAACTSGMEDPAGLQVRPLAEQGGSDVSRDAVFYEQAVTAIGRRDYATALDYLQAARANNPKNVRVMNAFGVVYDKLGRFDLSARYYAQALALDPGSKTVAQNMAYSRALQGFSAPQYAEAATVQPVAEQPPLAAPTIPVEAQPIQSAAFTRETIKATPPVAPDRIEPIFSPGALTFTSVNIEVPAETAVLPAVAPMPVPKSLNSDTFKVDLGEPAPVQTVFAGPSSPPALQPLSLSAPALTESEPAMPLPTPAADSLSYADFGFVLPDAPSFDVADTRPSAQYRASFRAMALPASLTMAAVDFSYGRPAEPVARERPVSFALEVAPPAAKPRMTSQAVAKNPLLIGRPLRIVNASGLQGATEPVHRSLTALGWSISKRRPTSESSLRTTTLVYPVVNTRVAQALARTLPFRVRMQPDPCACHGVQLFIGSDFLNWKAAGRHVPSVWRTSFDVASLATNKGVQ